MRSFQWVPSHEGFCEPLLVLLGDFGEVCRLPVPDTLLVLKYVALGVEFPDLKDFCFQPYTRPPLVAFWSHIEVQLGSNASKKDISWRKFDQMVNHSNHRRLPPSLLATAGF